MNEMPCGNNPLTLAYLGDAVFEVFVRGRAILGSSDTTGIAAVPVNRLHRFSTKYVKASAQALMIHRISDMLTEEERDIVRRGRNANTSNVPRKADAMDYRYATGFEALIGYLYLKKDLERLEYIMETAIASIGPDVK